MQKTQIKRKRKSAIKNRKMVGPVKVAKRKRIRKKSDRQRLIEKIESLIRESLRSKHGNTCQICGKQRNDCGIFHILPKGKYPKLRFLYENLLWVGWFCCHQPHHHDFYEARDRIYPKIQEILGIDFEDKLRIKDRLQESLTRTRLEEIYEDIKNETINN